MNSRARGVRLGIGPFHPEMHENVILSRGSRPTDAASNLDVAGNGVCRGFFGSRRHFLALFWLYSWAACLNLGLETYY